jgi:hypothetical protein
MQGQRQHLCLAHTPQLLLLLRVEGRRRVGRLQLRRASLSHLLLLLVLLLALLLVRVGQGVAEGSGWHSLDAICQAPHQNT